MHLHLAISRFSDVRVDRVIFTKLDEVVHVGVVLNVVRKVNKSLSYVTTGQEVPKDIEVGRGRVLARTDSEEAHYDPLLIQICARGTLMTVLIDQAN